MTLIKPRSGIIPACDVPLEVFETILRTTHDLYGIGGYKIGVSLCLEHGLSKVVELARRYTKKPLIYGHHNIGTDIPETGALFAKTLKDAEIDSVMLFQAEPETETAWIDAARDEGLHVIAGGYTGNRAVLAAYDVAIKEGVTDFVVPDNRPGFIRSLSEHLGKTGVDSTLYGSGPSARCKEVKDARDASGGQFHAIVGRGIYWSNMRNDYASFVEMRTSAIILTEDG